MEGQPEQTEPKSSVIDRRYFRGWLVIPKAIEVVCSLIAYICVEVEACSSTWTATYGYFKFISIAAMLTTLILWVMLLLKVPQRILRCDCVRWPFPELCYYAGVIVLYFFGDLFLALQGCGAGHDAGTAFGFIALFAYIFDLVWTGRTWWSMRREARSAAAQAQSQQVEIGSPEPKY